MSLFMIIIIVTLSLLLVMCESVRREVSGVCCAGHTPQPQLRDLSSDLAGKVCKSEQSKAKQPWQHQPGRARRRERREAWSPRPLARLWITAEDSDWSTELYSASDWLIQVRPWLRRLRGSHQATHLSQHHPLSSGETHYNILYLPLLSYIQYLKFYVYLLESWMI